MEIYIFGSIVRGEIDKFSDIDTLILKNSDENLPKIDKEQYSIYTYQRILELWKEGNPFAWHLFKESKCIFTPNKASYIESLGAPQKYSNMESDLKKFYNLFITSAESITKRTKSIDFDLSMIFLSIRNFATCFALGYLDLYEFSRNSALKISKYSIQIDDYVYNKLQESRILSTRGIGDVIEKKDLELIINKFPKIEQWFNNILKITNLYE